MKKINLLGIILLLILFSCAEDKEKEIPKTPVQQQAPSKKGGNENLNISLLLDLSDRIDTVKYHIPSMEQYQRDVAYIQSVAHGFVNHLRHKKLRALNDRIAVFFDPEPENPEINRISKDLKFHVTRNNATLELFDKIEDAYENKPNGIYQLALKDGKYVGSDTWGFFRNKVRDFCIEDGYRNILVILTDGYIYHKDNKRKEANKTSYLTPQDIRAFGLTKATWKEKMETQQYGFIPATSGLNDLEVLVLGINPDHKNVYEQEVIKAYWEQWLQAMGVARYTIKSNELPANLDKVIKEFLQPIN